MDLDAAVVGVLGVELLEERQRVLRARLELLVGVEIALDVVALRVLLGQGLEDAERLGLAFDDDHAHRPERRSEEHTSELQSQSNLVCRLLLEKKKVIKL